MGHSLRILLLLCFTIMAMAHTEPTTISLEVNIHQLDKTLIPNAEETKPGITNRLFAETSLKVYPNVFDKNASLLLYLKEPANTVHLSVIDTMGNIKDIPVSHAMTSGFYEISLIPHQNSSGMFKIRVIVDGKIYYQQITR